MEKNEMQGAKAIMMGDALFAGIEEDDISEVDFALVLKFKDIDSFRKALRDECVRFSAFDFPDS